MKIIRKKKAGYTPYSQVRVIDTILESVEARHLFEELLEKKEEPILESKRKAAIILRELTSSYNLKALRMSYWAVKLLGHSMFRHVHTYGSGLETAQKLTKEGKIIFFLPNHKSHMDYIFISYILYNHHIAPPHIAAGVNLAFWPMDTIFRNTGAYFIRRKISGNFLYTKLLELYFDWMLQQKISQEFYMEGGRSRDGKIRPAQTGIFRLFIEQVRELNMESEVYFVPISITYDRVPEMESLIREIKGLKKKKETTLSLVQSAGKIFQNHGDVHFHFDEPLELKSLLPNDISKSTFLELSNKLFSKIQRNKTISPSGVMATVILASNKTTTRHEVEEKLLSLVKVLMPCRNCMSERLANILQETPKLIKEYAGYGWYKIQGDEITINKRKRLEMNYYKNDVVPFLIPYSIAAFSGPLSSDELSLVQSILKHEYPYAMSEKQNYPQELATFFKSIHRPILHLYRQIFHMIIEMSLTNLSLPETHKHIRKLLKEKNFQPREVLTTEAIRSACRYYEQYSDAWKTRTVSTTHTFEKIFSES